MTCAERWATTRRDGDVDDLAGATAVVIASHGGPEAETIRAALDAGSATSAWWPVAFAAPSILNGLDLSDAERARVHTPVGLPIGAKTPAEIAVAIVAEVIEVDPGRRAESHRSTIAS